MGNEAGIKLNLSSPISPQEVQKLATYAIHYANCSIDSWDASLARCDCGLYQLLRRLEQRKWTDPDGTVHPLVDLKAG